MSSVFGMNLPRRRFDLYNAVPAAYVQAYSGLEAGLGTNRFWDDQTSGRIDGGYSGV